MKVTALAGFIKATLMIKQRKNIVKYSQKLKTGLFKPNYERGGLKEFQYIKRAIFISDLQVFVDIFEVSRGFNNFLLLGILFLFNCGDYSNI